MALSFSLGILWSSRPYKQASLGFRLHLAASSSLGVIGVKLLLAVIYPNEIPDEISSGVDFHRRSLVLLEDNIVEVATTLIISKVNNKYRNVLPCG
jgi:hypothetical protein